jgi:glycosyltransferase involved in cell wall biosynthesis
MTPSLPFCAPLAPLPEDGAPRPRWSVMIPTYRCARYLGDALRGVLAQDPGREIMQIAVVDDASDDDPDAVVRAVAGDRVTFFRQPSNRGHIANFQTCLERARGEVVHLLHGDDQVRPGFYEALGRGFESTPGLGAAFCRAVYLGPDGRETGMTAVERPEAGLLPDAAERLASEQRIMTPAIVVRRTVYEALGGFDRRLACAEDWEMWARIAAHYPIWYEPRALAVYRMHGASNTGRHVASAADAAYNRIAIGIIAGHLPPERAPEIARRARQTYAASALEVARDLLAQGNGVGYAAQVREAFRLTPSLGLLRRALGMALRSHRGRTDAR